ncbi:MAG: DNA cytosine methyltransferase [Desulfovibrionaceae bacterium]
MKTILTSAPEIFTAIDLFCGCGAVTEGIKGAGFQVISALDSDPVACGTYRANHPEVHLVEGDIREVQPETLIPDDCSKRSPDLMIVCAPCQPFSSQNRKKDGDARADLILEAVKFIHALTPRVVFFENVPGLASARNTLLLEQLRSGLVKRGYRLSSPLRLDAADFMVPQRRLRCVMFASLGTEPFPPPIPVTPEKLRITVQRSIGDLPGLRSGEQTEDTLHFARNHNPIALERMKFIPKDGGSRFSLPPELELNCHKGHKGHPDVYGRMRWDDVAPTLTTGCTDITRGRFMHPRDDRAISLREAARLQTFPDHYSFAGSPKEIATQIGNAVPVNFAKSIASAIHQALVSSTLG